MNTKVWYQESGIFSLSSDQWFSSLAAHLSHEPDTIPQKFWLDGVEGGQGPAV